MFEMFPVSALDSSIITSVWVGLMVVGLLNLRFGTTLSGLVIPGYLVPLLIIKPISAFVTVGEGLVTYAIARVLVREGYVWLGMGEMFGRDRFFAIVLISVIVRLVSDGFLLPSLGAWLQVHHVSFDYANHLHSFGLVIISLIANQMWNGGARRGLPVLVLYIALTYCIVRYGLMEFTNYSISNIGFMYEHLATSILASPKAYIVLLVAAFIASRMNLYYGWEFNGILLPALLALQWFDPLKLLFTLVEAFVILYFAKLALRIPWFSRRNMEGARLLLLFFNVGFLYKMVLASLLPQINPDVNTTDYFAFGYLLSTLLAIKVYQKDIAVRLTRATLQASLTALMVATVVGYALTFYPIKSAQSEGTEQSGTLVSTQALPQNAGVPEVLRRYKSSLYQRTDQALQPDQLAMDLEQFERGLRALLNYRDTKNTASIEDARLIFSAAGFQLERVTEHTIVLYETDARRGGGLYAINLLPASPLVVEVPAPLDEKGVAEAAIGFFDSRKAFGLALAGGDRRRLRGTSQDVLLNTDTFFHRFHRVLALDNTLQIRGLKGKQSNSSDSNALRANLYVKRSLPTGLSLADVERLTGPLEVIWGARGENNKQRDTSYSGFAELYLPLPVVRRVLARSTITKEVQALESVQPLAGYLYKVLASELQTGGEASRPPSVAPTLSELLYFNDEILAPLISLSRNADAIITESSAQDIALIATQAAAIDYELVLLKSPLDSTQHVLLKPHDGAQQRRSWGTYVFRIGHANSWVVQAPRPISEKQTFTFAVAFYERSGASALMIAPETTPLSASADVLTRRNKNTLFNLVHQSLSREIEDPLVFLQVRAFFSNAIPPELDAYLAYKEANAKPGVAYAAAQLEKAFERAALRIAPLAGELKSGDHDAGDSAQSWFLDPLPNKDMAVLWLPPSSRNYLTPNTNTPGEIAKFAALGIETVTVPFHQWLVKQPPGREWNHHTLSMTQQWINAFAESRDIVILNKLLTSTQARLVRLIDESSGVELLAFLDTQGWVAVSNLRPRSPAIRRFDTGQGETEARAFIDLREGWLIAGEKK